MVLLAVTADTWIVTGLGFGIVLVLLFCLVYILQFFGWTMQKIEAPKAPKTEKPAEKASAKSAEPTDEGTKAAIAMALTKAGDEDIAAIAYALYLAQNKKHDLPTPMISLRKHETAWNEKSIGMNNAGF
ncbi:MAG: OadG family protein [Paludibacteraceae bacterium]|nr:OadG family protein [Paludibacteraceae bacterium]